MGKKKTIQLIVNVVSTSYHINMGHANMSHTVQSTFQSKKVPREVEVWAECRVHQEDLFASHLKPSITVISKTEQITSSAYLNQALCMFNA